MEEISTPVEEEAQTNLLIEAVVAEIIKNLTTTAAQTETDLEMTIEEVEEPITKDTDCVFKEIGFTHTGATLWTCD